MNNLATIVIPIYKVEPSINEIKSLSQCFSVLNKYKKLLVCSSTLDITNYKKLLATEKNFDFVFFDKKYFESIAGYNRLLISFRFYKTFEKYDYILIYQLDAWVFRDELEYWCKKEFDYIGAPWFEGWTEANPDSLIVGVGNGGLSLRKTATFLKAKKKITTMNYFRKIYEYLSFDKIIPVSYFLRFYCILSNFTYTQEVLNIYFFNHLYEDVYWCLKVAKMLPFFKIAPVEEAIKFSFEVNAKVLYRANNFKLPFGCHAWEKYDITFWNSFIPD